MGDQDRPQEQLLDGLNVRVEARKAGDIAVGGCGVSEVLSGRTQRCQFGWGVKRRLCIGTGHAMDTSRLGDCCGDLWCPKTKELEGVCTRFLLSFALLRLP